MTFVPRLPQAGDRLGRYRILDSVGRGAFGAVYRAWDESLGREAALKILWPQYQTEERIRRRFEREARAAAGIDSPHVIRIYEVGEEEGIPFLAMEYCPGGPLIRPDAPALRMDWKRATGLVRDIAEGLAAAHAKAIVHRDLKPGNVLLDAAGRPKIADFGLARGLAEESVQFSTEGGLLGTPGYLAPEILEGEEAGPPADLYALGALLYRLLTGRLPFEGDTPASVLRKQLEGTVPRVAGEGIPADVDRILGGLLTLRPDERYPGAAFVREDFERLLRGERVEGPPAASNSGAGKGPAWMRWIPWGERTIRQVEDARITARREADAAAKRRADVEEQARGLARKAEESEADAEGWHVAAERSLSEGDEAGAREALGWARDHETHAAAYREEEKRHAVLLEECRAVEQKARADAKAVETKGTILLSRRARARMALGLPLHSFPRLAVGGALLFLLLVGAGAAILLRSSPPSHETDAETIEPSLISESSAAPELSAPASSADPAPAGPPPAGIMRFIEITRGRIPMDTYGFSLAAADVDRDGDLDLIAVVRNRGVCLLRNRGDASFFPPEVVAPPGFEYIRVADVNMDKAPDLLLSPNQWAFGNISLMANHGNGTFGDATTLWLPPLTSRSNRPLFLDIDGDGDSDLFVPRGFEGNPGQIPAAAPELLPSLLWKNDDARRFVDITSDHLPPTARASVGAAAGDIDGDGDEDIVVNVRGNMNQVLVNDGTGRFRDESAQRWPSGIQYPSPNIELVDIDQDGDQDAVVAMTGPTGQGDGDRVRLYKNNGRGVFSDVTAEQMPFIVSHPNGDHAMGDLNLDGYPEILIGSSRFKYNDNDIIFQLGAIYGGGPSSVLARIIHNRQ